MAIYHLSVKPVSRAVGRSATAAAAYRSGELVQDMSTGEVFDYTRRRGVEYTEIVLPTAAARQDIHWPRERQALWNAAEAAENRSNSRVAREYELALPHELNQEQRQGLVQTFSQQLADRYGVAVDIAIHQPHRNGDERNHHAHLLTTTRVIEAGGLGEKSPMEWSDTNRRKAGLGPAKQEITAVRGLWETLANEHLQALGVAARIDHRSLEAQGIEREPQSHLGPAVSGMERRGMETEVGKRIAWERQAAAQQRLERAAEAGRLEREKTEVSQSIVDLSGDLNAARAARERGADRTPERGATPGKKRGMFDGLKLPTGRSPQSPAAPSASHAADAPTPEPVRVDALHESLERYARAWLDVGRMQEQALPVLAHQRAELAQAQVVLDTHRPGATQDLGNALQYEPATRRALYQLEGLQRSQALLAGVEHEEAIRRDPELRAGRVVKEWNGLEAEQERLRGWEHADARKQVKERSQALVLAIKRSPALEAALKHRAPELGIAPGSRLARVVNEPDLKRALSLSEHDHRHGFRLSM